MQQPKILTLSGAYTEIFKGVSTRCALIQHAKVFIYKLHLERRLQTGQEKQFLGSSFQGVMKMLAAYDIPQ